MADQAAKIPFRSALGKLLAEFLQEKRACGHRYEREAYALREFDRFLEAEGTSRPELPKTLVERWVAKRPHEQPSTHKKRVTLVRQLAAFLDRHGCPAYSPPPRVGRRVQVAFSARIYSRDEIRRILQAADDLPVCPWSPLRHLVMPELFRVLYGCGLRLGEALRLTVADVDLSNGVLRIRQGKFRRDRLVPMASSLRSRLERYAESLGTRSPDAPFFPSPRGGTYRFPPIYLTFRRLLEESGIPHEGRGRGPRLHELRHAFAVHRLERWYREGADLRAKLPLLATYLGHRCMVGTQVYLQVTQTLFSDLAERLDARFGQVIPGRTK